MTSDTCGPTSGTPFASYDPESRSWRTSEATSLWALTLSSLTLPNWGCLHDGELYELPTPEPPTDALDSSSSLHKTPHAGLGERGRDGVYPNPKGQYDLQHQMANILLPTPSANDTTGSETAEARAARSAGGPMLRDIPALLPTPTVMDMGSNYTPEQWEAWKAEQKANHANGNGHGASLTQEAISLLGTPRSQMGSMTAKPNARLETDVGQLIGASTPPPSTAGSTSSGDPHPAPPSPAPTDDPDCLPLSWNG